jgi:hypothetical protein
MTTLPTLYQQQQDIMSRFDFERVQVAMQALNWTWQSRPVTVDMMKATVMELMDRTAQKYNGVDGWCSIATGGFEARVDEVGGSARMSLSFRIESIDASLVWSTPTR